MNCINAKCKSKRRVQTIRTYNLPTGTRRQKKCSKCGNTFHTIEIEESAYERMLLDVEQLKNQVREAEEAARESIEEVAVHIRALLNLATPRVKKSK